MKRIFLILMMAVGLATIAFANQNREISGSVTDESGAALPGVSICVENTSRGTVSDVNGFYKIMVNPGDKRLVFSFIGMITEKVKIPETDRLNVVLKADEVGLEEVVVVAYGVQKKANLCGAVAGVGVNRALYFQPQADCNTENYSTIRENGFKDVNANPLSTFSIDVDRASYSNVRRYINQGNLPPVDAVKVEEMINYFDYDYSEPTGEHPFSVTTEVSTCPWNSKHYLMHIGLQGKHIDKTNLPASNLVFLLDVSGSMNAPDKLPLVKRAFTMLVNELRPEDRVAIVVYAGAAGKVLDSTPGDKKKTILDALEKLGAGGSTAGGEGLRLAYKIAEENFIEGGNNRIILATDGDFNIGVSSTSEMERLVEKERENGVFMTVLGFGTGNIKDDKMETIADKGNGNYAYIDNIQEARKVFITEFGGTLFTIAKDVKFQLEFNPKQVKSYRLMGYENRLLNDEDFNDDKKDAGEMGTGHTVTALYEIIPANIANDDRKPSVDPLKYQTSKTVSGKVGEELLTIKLRYKAPEGGRSRLLEIPVANNLQKNTSDNFRFSAAVAEFGMLLRRSEFAGSTNIKSILELARAAKGEDEEGYRSEFIQLVKMVDDLQLLSYDK
ncbi:VWA domain-containing protein [Maribellus sp. YY47]|uniref:vWA domain-containing protein n=1 Tax=Maribellus sp. YY47 TaxID=2929486 RepID=UPI002000A62A|nr:VWA domain-containing protein [Maribellus sp. YY47]MCK3684310.1 von Willebrand factor type A domain-containing protein [Maribellus sp. YY47]